MLYLVVRDKLTSARGPKPNLPHTQNTPLASVITTLIAF